VDEDQDWVDSAYARYAERAAEGVARELRDSRGKGSGRGYVDLGEHTADYDIEGARKAADTMAEVLRRRGHEAHVRETRHPEVKGTFPNIQGSGYHGSAASTQYELFFSTETDES
jgi:hypothetical protein